MPIPSDQPLQEIHPGLDSWTRDICCFPLQGCYHLPRAYSMLRVHFLVPALYHVLTRLLYTHSLAGRCSRWLRRGFRELGEPFRELVDVSLLELHNRPPSCFVGRAILGSVMVLESGAGGFVPGIYPGVYVHYYIVRPLDTSAPPHGPTIP